MYLHQNKTAFMKTIFAAAKQSGIDESIIEKDYYVFMVLKGICKHNPYVMFKGGTSLSKAYNVIKRFSEDLDINAVPELNLSEVVRKKFHNTVKDSFVSLGLMDKEECIKNKSDFVCIKKSYNSLYNGSSSGITDVLKVETVLRRKGRVLSCKYVTKPVSNYIYDYLCNNPKYLKMLQACDLTPFEVKVQDARYTFCEKLIAVGNYYMRNKPMRSSRHLYDLYKLSSIVKIDNELRKIFLEVVHYTKERGFDDAILSNNLEDCIYKALKSNFYEDDYNSITSKFIFENVPYSVCVNNLCKILLSGLCDSESTSLQLKDIVVRKKVTDKGKICGYLISPYGVDKFTFIDKQYIATIKDRLCNCYLSSDGKLIPKFGITIDYIDIKNV